MLSTRLIFSLGGDKSKPKFLFISILYLANTRTINHKEDLQNYKKQFMLFG